MKRYCRKCPNRIRKGGVGLCERCLLESMSKSENKKKVGENNVKIKT